MTTPVVVTGTMIGMKKLVLTVAIIAAAWLIMAQTALSEPEPDD